MFLYDFGKVRTRYKLFEPSSSAVLLAFALGIVIVTCLNLSDGQPRTKCGNTNYTRWQYPEFLKQVLHV